MIIVPKNNFEKTNSLTEEVQEYIKWANFEADNLDTLK
jgi:hypothetical protein